MVSYPKKLIMRYNQHRKTLREETQLIFLQRLYRLLENGYSIIAALHALTFDKRFKWTVDIIVDHLKKGDPVDVAFERAEFNDIIISFLYFVRINGQLQNNIRLSQHILKKRLMYKEKFINILRYPTVLFIFFFILLFFIKIYIIPSFNQLFQTHIESTPAALLSMYTIDVIMTVLIVCLCCTCIGLLLWRLVHNKLHVETKIKIISNIPIYRHYVKLQMSYYFATHFSLFLKAGLSLKDILKHMTNQRKLPIISHYTSLMMEELNRGFYIYNLMKQFSLFDVQLVRLFKDFNNDDMLAQDLHAYADYIAETIQQKVMRTLTVVQPLFFLLLAAFIIFIYLTLMWPMFEFIQSI